MTFAIYSRPYTIRRVVDGRALALNAPEFATNCRRTMSRYPRHDAQLLFVVGGGKTAGCAARSGSRWVVIPHGPPDVSALYLARRRQLGLVELPDFNLTLDAAREAVRRYDASHRA